MKKRCIKQAIGSKENGKEGVYMSNEIQNPSQAHPSPTPNKSSQSAPKLI
jgi:hypothetical protein